MLESLLMVALAIPALILLLPGALFLRLRPLAGGFNRAGHLLRLEEAREQIVTLRRRDVAPALLGIPVPIPRTPRAQAVVRFRPLRPGNAGGAVPRWYGGSGNAEAF